MNIAVWVLQGLLAAVFLFHARLSLMPPTHERLNEGMWYILDMPPSLRVFAGVTEGLAAFGLIVPQLVGVATWLTPTAASGLVLLMLGAIVLHLRRREYPNIGFSVALAVMAAFVAVARWAE